MEQTNNSVQPEGIVSPATKKREMPPKSKIANYVMFGALALFLILFIVFFNVGDAFKTQYSDLGVKILNEGISEAEKAELQAQRDAAGASYTVFAVLSYLSSILALVSLGVGLAVADKLKQKEEEVAERE